MEEKEINMNECVVNINDIFTLDNIPRCLECNLIPSLKILYKENKTIINYFCENNHKGEISLEEYLNKYNNKSLLKQACGDCKKEQNKIKGDFFYCNKCNKFLCNLCSVNHPYNEKHNTINIKRYDSFCKEHSNSFSLYCRKCKKNICVFCNSQHETHNKINLHKVNFPNDEKNKLEKKFKDIENKIINLDKIKKGICEMIEKIKKSSELEMKFYKILINTYKYEEIQNNINYDVIQNLKEFEKILGSNTMHLYETAYKEGIKYINFLKNIKESMGQTNLMKKNFKTIKEHTDYICHISELNDGRLISCSNDCTVKIYKRDTFDLQLTIKEHSDIVRYFTQLSNDKIATCSDDFTINIIRLRDEDNYDLEQKLKEHNGKVRQLIEFKENVLISVSKDNTMRKWEITKKENKFECMKYTNFQNSGGSCNILKINENEFVVSSYCDNFIRFYNSDFKEIETIKNVNVEYASRVLCMINDDTLCVGGRNSKGFYLINVSEHKIIKNIEGPKVIYSIYKCLDSSILCSVTNEKGNCALVKYKYENQNMNKIIEKEKIHEGNIFACYETNDGIIASGGDDKSITLWYN